MKFKTIQSKVLAALVVCLVLGTGCVIELMNYFTTENSKALSVQVVASSQKLFAILEAREVSKMTAVSDTLLTNPQIPDAFAARDRARLLALTAPLYPKLKAEGITNWMFHTSNPGMAVFLRLHNPAKFGDQLNRFIDKQVVSSNQPVTGNELAKAGFALRIIRPVSDAKGATVGYLEFGEELGQFIHVMKAQTGNEYALLLNKKFVNRQFWADSSAMLKRRDTWNDNNSSVVADNTTSNDSILQFDGDLAAVPAEGQSLGAFKSGGAVFVRGIFPIHDAAGNSVGAMFVVRDISAEYASIRKTQNFLLVLTFVSLSVGILSLLFLLDRFVFRRLRHIILCATRLVGGDFDTSIKIDAEDEVGKLEQLFEQFRQVFVNILKQFTELEVTK